MGPPIQAPSGSRFITAAGRRADLAELGVDGRAVVALVVVLGQNLPVGRHVVVVAGGDDELVAGVVPDELPQVADVLLERGRVAARVGEEPAVPLDDAHRDERPPLLLEAVRPSETRRSS
jgi:hypothetical protein